jgi:hypothetical protein
VWKRTRYGQYTNIGTIPIPKPTAEQPFVLVKWVVADSIDLTDADSVIIEYVPAIWMLDENGQLCSTRCTVPMVTLIDRVSQDRTTWPAYRVMFAPR